MKHRGLAAAGIACVLTTALLTGSAGEGAHAAGSPGTAASAARAAGAATGATSAAVAANCTPAGLGFTGFPEYRKFRDSRRLRTPVVMHGALTDTTGAPIRGAVVLLAATSADLTTMVPVAVNRTDRDGRYVLRTAMTRKLRALHERHGVDLHMEWFTPAHRHLVWVSTVKWDQDRRAWGGTKVTDPAHRGPATRTATARNREHITLDPRAGADVSGWCAHTSGHTRHPGAAVAP